MLMKPRLFPILVIPAALLLAALTGGGCATDKDRPVVVVTSPKVHADAPPPARVEVRTVPPGEDHIWTPGYWTSVNHRWIWIPGAWSRADVAVGGGVDVE